MQAKKQGKQSLLICAARGESFLSQMVTGVSLGPPFWTRIQAAVDEMGGHTTCRRKKKFKSAPIPAAVRDEESIIVVNFVIEQQYWNTKNSECSPLSSSPQKKNVVFLVHDHAVPHTCALCWGHHRICVDSGVSPTQLSLLHTTGFAHVWSFERHG